MTLTVRFRLQNAEIRNLPGYYGRDLDGVSMEQGLPGLSGSPSFLVYYRPRKPAPSQSKLALSLAEESRGRITQACSERSRGDEFTTFFVFAASRPGRRQYHPAQQLREQG